MAFLYPDPPHLTAVVYCDALAEPEVFSRVCAAVRSHGAVASGRIEVFPRGIDFRYTTELPDINDKVEEIEAPAGRFWDLVSGRDPHLSAVNAGFMAEPGGRAVSGRPDGEPARQRRVVGDLPGALPVRRGEGDSGLGGRPGRDRAAGPAGGIGNDEPS